MHGVAQQFGGQIPAIHNLAWDVFFLFDGDAEWNEKPEPLLGTGFPIIGATQILEEEMTPLLTQ